MSSKYRWEKAPNLRTEADFFRKKKGGMFGGGAAAKAKAEAEAAASASQEHNARYVLSRCPSSSSSLFALKLTRSTTPAL